MRTKLSRESRVGFAPLCLLLFTVACDREPGILVNIAMWPDGVGRIRVRPTLGGSLGTDIYVGRDQSRFVVRLPVGTQGTVQLDADGFDDVDCKVASGSLTEQVPAGSGYFVERTLELVPKLQRECIFAPEVRYGVGSQPSSVAVADFNGDQNLDLVVANYGNTNVGLLLGDGHGVFGSATNSPMGIGPLFVVAGDLNGDQKPDVATANFVEHDVSVRLGTFLGGLSALTNIPIIVPLKDMGMPAPSSIAIGELNGDGIPDLVITKHLSNEISVLRGDGLGGFRLDSTFCASEMSPCEPTRPYTVAVTDLDGDQKSDLVFTNYTTGDLRVLRGNGSGGFSWAGSYRVGDYPEGIAVADLNRDGRPDLITANSGSNTVSVLLNLPGGLAPPPAPVGPFPVGIGPISIAIADFNGDQKLDLAVANYGTPAVHGQDISVLLGNGVGGFGSAMSFPVGFRPQSVAIGDFNRDGRPDLAVANSEADPGKSVSSVSILLNRF